MKVVSEEDRGASGPNAATVDVGKLLQTIADLDVLFHLYRGEADMSDCLLAAEAIHVLQHIAQTEPPTGNRERM